MSWDLKVNLTSKHHSKYNTLHMFFLPNYRQDIRKNITNETRCGQVSRKVIYIQKMTQENSWRRSSDDKSKTTWPTKNHRQYIQYLLCNPNGQSDPVLKKILDRFTRLSIWVTRKPDNTRLATSEEASASEMCSFSNKFWSTNLIT